MTEIIKIGKCLFCGRGVEVKRSQNGYVFYRCTNDDLGSLCGAVRHWSYNPGNEIERCGCLLNLHRSMNKRGKVEYWAYCSTHRVRIFRNQRKDINGEVIQESDKIWMP